jgi:hypothetical protein
MLRPSEVGSIVELTACQVRFLLKEAPMRSLLRKRTSWFGGFSGLLILFVSSAVIAQTQPTAPLPTLPRLKLTAQDEYVIRENLLTDTNLPKQGSATDTVGDVVPQNVKLNPLPPEVVQKVPKAQGYQFFVKDGDTVILVSPSDRRVADIIKKKPTD